MPVEGVEKLLTTMDMGDALKTLNVLRRIPPEISRKCAKVSVTQPYFIVLFFDFYDYWYTKISEEERVRKSRGCKKFLVS